MPHSLTRRALLQNLGVIGAVAALPLGCSSEEEEGAPIFNEGVASGDPLPTAVILWTRVTSTDASVDVKWEISTSREFARIDATGTFQTNADRDYTVKVDATGLTAGTTYYYRFSALGRTSPVGRTRTAATGTLSRLRLGVVSCASLAHGYFHAYRHLATRLDLDAIVHLGDYIYEYGNKEYGSVRSYEPSTEILTLSDYRTRYRQYRHDPDLQALHKQFPFITVWDDHELADNAWSGGAENHQPGEGDFNERKKIAAKVYSEWMPIRDQGDGSKIYRGFEFGDLVDLTMLDTRIIGRDKQVEKLTDPELNDDKRGLLGAEQEKWLSDRLTASTAKWQIIGQQVMVGVFPIQFNADAWDGYPAARERLYKMLEANPTKNVVFLTGDIHMSFGLDLPRDPKSPDYDPATGKGSLAVEFVTPAVTSQGLPDQLANVGPSLMTDNRHVHFADVNQRGYMVLDATPERVQCSWYLTTEVAVPVATPKYGKTLAVKAGTKNLVPDTEAPAPPNPPAAA